MTKVFELGLYEGVYCLEGQREREGKLIPTWQKLLCWEFVKLVSGYEAQWLSVRVTVSTDPISAKEGVARLQVRQEGFYRWSWRWHEADPRHAYFTFFNSSFGMYFAVEDVLRDFFPSEVCRDDGLDNYKDLWIRISDPAE